MRQPGSVQVAFVVDEDLGLVDQSAKRRGMNDSIAVALVFRPVCGRGFRVAAAARVLGMRGIGREAVHAVRRCVSRRFI
jgi:hypothetical protein